MVELDLIKMCIVENERVLQEKFSEENIIDREIRKNIERNIGTDVAVFITGVRRCGKSILAYLISKNKKAAYVNFEDERLSIKGSELNKVMEAIYSLKGKIGFFVFDEIQNIEGWEKFIARIIKNKKVIITGSNARLLSKELSSFLTGRHIDFVLFPFSFKIYLAFEEWGFRTTFLVSVNDLVIEQCVDDFLVLDIPCFFSWRSHRFFPSLSHTTAPPDTEAPDTESLDTETLDTETLPSRFPIFLYTTYDAPTFARDARFRLWEGATVTYVCLQLAFHMGFEQVILIGVDHSFSAQGRPNQTVVSDGDDPNHFDPRYFGKGFRWQLPDLETSEIAYRMARRAYEKAGREILDATIGGKLTVFPKVKYDSLFG